MAQPPSEPLMDRLRRLRARETDPTTIRLLDFLLADLELHGEAAVTSRSIWPAAIALLDRIEAVPRGPRHRSSTGPRPRHTAARAGAAGARQESLMASRSRAPARKGGRTI